MCQQKTIEPKYLGDGVYAAFENDMIKLMANDHLHPTDTIYLEASVYYQLVQFAEQIVEEKCS